MSDIQELNRRSSFIFVGDLNSHHQEWLKSVSLTDCYGIIAFNFTNLSCCTQLIIEPTHKLGNCLDVMLTDVPDVVDSLVDPPLGNSDHSSISSSVKMSFKIPNITFSGKVYLKSNVVWLLKVVRRKVNDKAWFNKDCINTFHNKQNEYRLWSQNRSHFLWEEYVLHSLSVMQHY